MEETKMKLFIFLIIFMNISSVYSNNGWSIPIPISDSLSHNTNCTVKLIDFSDANEPDSLFIFWEKSTDANSTSIYYRDLFSMSEPKLIIYQENVHFKNPQVMRCAINDTLFYLFYESDQDGNEDIYYLKYIREGRFSAPVPFRTTEYVKKDVYTTDYEIVWIENDDLYYSDLYYSNNFSSPIMIDNNYCTNPGIHEYGPVVWEKNNQEKAQIYYSEQEIEGWQEPILLYGIGDNRNLAFDQPNGWRQIVWQNKTDTLWNIFFSDANNDYKVDSLDFSPASNKTEPSILFIAYVSKIDHECIPKLYDSPMSSVLTFVIDSIYEQNEIFAGEFYYENISNNSWLDRNPQLFEKGGYSPYYVVLNIWESFVNGHWQLYMSEKAYDVGAIESEKNFPNAIQLYQNYPNPFNPNTTISFNIEKRGKVILSIYNNLGQKVRTLIEDEKSSGKYEVTWDCRDDSGKKLSSGIYYYKLVSNGRHQTKRMIYVK
jgi:hypothetical protein